MTSFKRLSAALAFLLVAVSCGKGGGEATLDVTPLTLTAPYTLSTQDIHVSCSGSWSVQTLSRDGTEISWAKPNKTQGQGDGTLSIRVLQNDFSGVREALITITANGGKSVTVSLSQEGNPAGGDQTELTIRVGTYNIRVASNGETDAQNNWENRKNRLLQSITENNFDIFGVNECKTSQQTWLKEEFQDQYTFHFFSPYAQNGTGDKAQGIGLKKGFSLSDWHFFWLNENPDVMVTNDGSYNRGGCCGIVTHGNTGIKIFFMVTHGALNDAVRDNMAYLYQKMEEKYNPSSLPSFFVGDMNALPSSACSTSYREYWSDTYTSVSQAAVSGPSTTYNAFDLTRNLYTTGNRIDFIYYRNATPSNYVCNDKKYGGYYASDHLPIYSDMKVKYVTQ